MHAFIHSCKQIFSGCLLCAPSSWRQLLQAFHSGIPRGGGWGNTSSPASRGRAFALSAASRPTRLSGSHARSLARPRPPHHVTRPPNQSCRAQAGLSSLPVASAGATTKGNPKEWGGGGGSRSRCFLFQFRSAPVTFSLFAVAIFLSVCMSPFVWGGSGDHVGGKSEEAPGAWDEVTAVGTPPRLPPHLHCGPVAPSAPVETPACSCGLARSATKSRAVSRESKLKEHGDV